MRALELRQPLLVLLHTRLQVLQWLSSNPSLARRLQMQLRLLLL